MLWTVPDWTSITFWTPNVHPRLRKAPGKRCAWPVSPSELSHVNSDDGGDDLTGLGLVLPPPPSPGRRRQKLLWSHAGTKGSTLHSSPFPPPLSSRVLSDPLHEGSGLSEGRLFPHCWHSGSMPIPSARAPQLHRGAASKAKWGRLSDVVCGYRDACPSHRGGLSPAGVLGSKAHASLLAPPPLSGPWSFWGWIPAQVMTTTLALGWFAGFNSSVCWHLLCSGGWEAKVKCHRPDSWEPLPVPTPTCA